MIDHEDVKYTYKLKGTGTGHLLVTEPQLNRHLKISYQGLDIKTLCQDKDGRKIIEDQCFNDDSEFIPTFKEIIVVNEYTNGLKFIRDIPNMGLNIKEFFIIFPKEVTQYSAQRLFHENPYVKNTLIEMENEGRLLIEPFTERVTPKYPLRTTAPSPIVDKRTLIEQRMDKGVVYIPLSEWALLEKECDQLNGVTYGSFFDSFDVILLKDCDMKKTGYPTGRRLSGLVYPNGGAPNPNLYQPDKKIFMRNLRSHSKNDNIDGKTFLYIPNFYYRKFKVPEDRVHFRYGLSFLRERGVQLHYYYQYFNKLAVMEADSDEIRLGITPYLLHLKRAIGD